MKIMRLQSSRRKRRATAQQVSGEVVIHLGVASLVPGALPSVPPRQDPWVLGQRAALLMPAEQWRTGCRCREADLCGRDPKVSAAT